MALFKKKAEPYVDPVQVAHESVVEALDSFLTAKLTLEAAHATYTDAVNENNDMIVHLEARNKTLTTEADRALRVATKLDELTV